MTDNRPLIVRLVHDRAGGPSVLLDAWRSGEVKSEELGEYIPETWRRCQSPVDAIGQADWIEMFKAAGPVLNPTSLRWPTDPVLLYRGTSSTRQRGMSWVTVRTMAAEYLRRHRRSDSDSWLYRTVAPVEAVLALLAGTGEGIEYIVDPTNLEIARVDD